MKARIPEEGEIREDQVYHNGDWQTLDTGLTLYEVNQQLVAQLPDMSEDEIMGKEAIFDNYVKTKATRYCMILSNELHYYTIFNITEDNPYLLSCAAEAINCLVDFADAVKSIELTEDESAIEIWIKKDDQYHVMYFFDYTQGVIECRHK